MKLNRSYIVQLTIGIIVFIIISILVNNLFVNLNNKEIGFSLNWLSRPSSFALSEYSFSYSPSNSYAWALFIGWINSLRVIISSLILATIVGLVVGLTSKARNPLLRLISKLYVGLVRQTPLLLQLMFWYFVFFLGLKSNLFQPIDKLFSISNQGLVIASIKLSPEYSALFFGLSIFTSAYISEIIRGGLNSVPYGQWESFRSLGLSDLEGIQYVIIPQSLPTIFPGLTNQYLNLAKNSTLAIAVGYPDIYAISDTIINQTGRSIEGFLLLLISFLFLNLLITNLMEILSKTLINNRIASYK